MRIVLQRVSQASVSVDNNTIASISQGFLILLGIEEQDTSEDLDWLTRKIINMRVFEDSDGKMNQSLLDISGELLVVSQFTLHASTKKGNRPSFIRAARPEIAEPLYHQFCQTLENLTSKPPACGSFGANMQVSLINDGPVTITIDSKNKE